jgi:hypothetical protein
MHKLQALFVSLFVSSLIAGAGCAAQTAQQHGRPVNVALVRHEIQGNLDGRTITAMGRTRDDSAVVYTRDASGTRHEETWVREGRDWKLTNSAAIASNE